jgi:hypothetical protein
MTLPLSILQVDEKGMLIWMPWWIEERLDLRESGWRVRLTFPAIKFQVSTRGKVTLSHILPIYFRPKDDELFISAKQKKSLTINIYFPQDDIQLFRTEGIVIEIFRDGHIEFANESDPLGFFEPDVIYNIDTRTVFFDQRVL